MCYSHLLPDNITRQQRGGFINEILNFTFTRLEQSVRKLYFSHMLTFNLLFTCKDMGCNLLSGPSTNSILLLGALNGLEWAGETTLMCRLAWPFACCAYVIRSKVP